MRVRWQFLVVGLACSLAGCGEDASQMRFVENTTFAKPVHRKARAVVTKTLEEHFGTPINSVAWLKLPVKYGRAEGTIKAVDDRTLTVAFNPEASDISGFESPEFSGTELLFTSGALQGKTITLASFDGKTNSFEAANLESAPAENDQFVVAGHALKHGRKLYARHCQHCHGISGDGDGSTAKYLNPRPRDYRLGVFKFTSTKTGERASRDDLKRIISLGIPGTYMPAFVPMLKDHELASIIEYVRWLALRGEVERQLLTELKGDYAADRAKKEAKETGSKESEIEKQIDAQLKEYQQAGLAETLQEIVSDLADKWAGVEEEGAAIIPPVARTPDSAESRERGKKLFIGNDAKCANCHGVAGRGNGPQTEDFAKNPRTGEFYSERGLHDDWDQVIKPRDLTRGIYRGGRRPLDVYRRISEGIKGTPMPGGSKSLKPEQIWDLVNYVMSIPFESASPKTAKPHSVAGQPSEQGNAN